MIKKIALFLTFFNVFFAYSQVVINEIDADTPSTDVLEFIELKSTTPNFSLDGYVLVFFNAGSAGLTTVSYYALDLDGLSTDINGIIHLGNSQVSPTPAYTIQNATIQNGPDAVALYQGNDSDFPLNTVAHNIGLIDALAYSNSATVQPTALMSIFGITVCTNENQNLNAATKSIQRMNDGTYEVNTPTPGINNDGSGIVLNYISIVPNVLTINEGQALQITFSTSMNVTDQPLTFNYLMSNGSFTNADFSGSTSVTIPVGSNSAVVSNLLINDGNNEGDEELKIRINTVPTGYSLNNNNIIVRVNDINFSVQPFGTPLNPTYNLVNSTAPVGYYDSLEGLAGNELKQALQNIIANPSEVRAHNYGDVIDILKEADQNPANSNQVWLMYVEEPRSKLDFQDSNSNIGKWNREHIFPQSRGGFQDGTSSTPDGINVWLPTNADDILAGHGDAHHIRAEDGAENSLRSNRDYGSDYNGPSGSAGSWHGDVARSLFYMAVRYNGLNLVNGNPADTIVGQMGDLASLLTWNTTDPADDFEMNRNNYIYTWQHNRNPFIDYPNLADYIFGANFGQAWSFSLANQQNGLDNRVYIFPNPTNGDFKIVGSNLHDFKIEVYNPLGELVYTSFSVVDQTITSHLSSGLYVVQISNSEQTFTKKLIVK